MFPSIGPAWGASSSLSSLLPLQQQQWPGRLALQRLLSTSSDAQQQGLTLKAALRQLYKRVHPDLFTDYPAEQAENERSFKLLQDYLHQARHPSSGPASRTAFLFRFFLQPPAGSSDCSGPSGFQLVSLHLPPPTPSRSGAGQLSGGAQQGLRKLLGMCGLPALADEQLGSDTAHDTQHLTHFLPEAAEVVRQHESGVAQLEVQVANLKAAMRLAHQVIVGFQPGMFPRGQQVELLQRLAAALDLLTDDRVELSGLKLLICQRTGLDSQGSLLLDAGDLAEAWADFLGGVDLDWARSKAAAGNALRQLEARVAAALGVRMLFTAAPFLMTHEYRSFLERMAAYAAEHGPVRMSSSSVSADEQPLQQLKPFQNIPVYVAPPPQQQQQQQQAEDNPVHEMGYITVPMSAGAPQVCTAIKAHGRAAAAILSKKQADEQELAAVTSTVRTRLGLRRLLRDELISLQEFKSCCTRLLHHRDLLLRCNIEGLSVRVSDRNRVSADGSVVDIAWNFQM